MLSTYCKDLFLVESHAIKTQLESAGTQLTQLLTQNASGRASKQTHDAETEQVQTNFCVADANTQNASKTSALRQSGYSYMYVDGKL